MNSFSDYKYLLGETIIVYQLIENDLRNIGALSIVGEYHSNLAKISYDYKSLGQLVGFLKEMDGQRENPLLSEEDYRILSNLVRKRNHYCHRCAIDFVYEPNFPTSEKFASSYALLKDDHDRMLVLQEKIENIKVLLAQGQLVKRD